VFREDFTGIPAEVKVVSFSKRPFRHSFWSFGGYGNTSDTARPDWVAGSQLNVEIVYPFDLLVRQE